jgi:hypothetical protein
MSEMHSFTEGEPIEGILTNKESGKGQDGNSNVYTLKNDSGDVKFWGCAVLDSQLGGIETGNRVRITYLGKVKGKSGREYKDFEVEVEDVIQY